MVVELVPLKGGIGSIFHPPEGKDYKWYILPIGGLYATYHLLGEPETTTEICQIPHRRWVGSIWNHFAAKWDSMFFSIMGGVPSHVIQDFCLELFFFRIWRCGINTKWSQWNCSLLHWFWWQQSF